MLDFIFEACGIKINPDAQKRRIKDLQVEEDVTTVNLGSYPLKCLNSKSSKQVVEVVISLEKETSMTCPCCAAKIRLPSFVTYVETFKNDVVKDKETALEDSFDKLLLEMNVSHVVNVHSQSHAFAKAFHNHFKRK